MRLGERSEENGTIEKSKMEALKLKTFDVLTEVIDILEFEQWLYTDQRVLDSLDSDDLVFDIMTLNYKEKNSLDKLLKLTSEKFSFEENLLVVVVFNCRKIMNAVSREELFGLVSTIKTFFSFDDEYNLLWEFYGLKEQIDLIEEGFVKEGNITQKIKNLGGAVISEFEGSTSLKDKLKILDYKSDSTSNFWGWF